MKTLTQIALVLLMVISASCARDNVWHSKAKLFVSTNDESLAELRGKSSAADNFVKAITSREFADAALKEHLELAGKFSTTSVHLVPKSSVVEISTIGTTREASVAAAHVISAAIVTEGERRNLRVRFVLRPDVIE